MKVKFLFWNINNVSSPFEKEIDKIVKDNNIDVLVLSENEKIPTSNILKNTDFVSVDLKLDNGKSKWIQVFYKKNDNYVITHHNEYTELEDENCNGNSKKRKVNRIQVFKISGKIPDTYFACIHFPSKLYHDEITHLQIVPNYKEKVHSLTLNSKRIFIVGDFNMNPFDLGMVEPTGFFAHNNREVVNRESQLKYGATSILYYNPSWTLLGDFVNNKSHQESSRMGGSYYFKEQKSRCLYWHLIDQLIMRKTLIEEFVSEDLQIIEKESIVEEVKKDKICGANKIDHFPLQFSYEFQNN